MRRLWNWLRYQRCRYQYWCLSPKNKRMMDILGIAPEQLKKDGHFDDS